MLRHKRPSVVYHPLAIVEDGTTAYLTIPYHIDIWSLGMLGLRLEWKRLVTYLVGWLEVLADVNNYQVHRISYRKVPFD